MILVFLTRIIDEIIKSILFLVVLDIKSALNRKSAPEAPETTASSTLRYKLNKI